GQLRSQRALSRHAPKQLWPAAELQGLQDGETRIAEAAGELQRVNPVVVDDGVDVDVPAVAAGAQLRFQATQGFGEERLAASIRYQRPHLAGELAKVAREEALVLPVETGG